jgi:hypothetical protein
VFKILTMTQKKYMHISITFNHETVSETRVAYLVSKPEA